MNAQLLRRVRALRAMNPYIPMPLMLAVVQARSELTPDLSGYDFLAGLNDYDSIVTGEIGPFDITVTIEADNDSELGEDDVTGTFGDIEQDHAISNTTHGTNGSDYKYYYPSSSRIEEMQDTQWTKGLSKAVRADYYRWLIEEDMTDDSERRYLGVSVEVSLDGQELGSSSLWGVDILDKYPAEPYLIEVAIENIDEALHEVRKNGAKLLAEARTHTERLAAALATLVPAE